MYEKPVQVSRCTGRTAATLGATLEDVEAGGSSTSADVEAGNTAVEEAAGEGETASEEEDEAEETIAGEGEAASEETCAEQADVEGLVAPPLSRMAGHHYQDIRPRSMAEEHKLHTKQSKDIEEKKSPRPGEEETLGKVCGCIKSLYPPRDHWEQHQGTK
ncbi:hypothetical protein Pcinc_038978 [Petrolisthes cinctipes]|uniref:Uncharacterized protein n=1 Tax=Petrolisthes cinctipes TaxID=88211 RepID=A0AAE1BPE2_PETCI|nr:hypothetical protein Pcinc_038978 [Petrolisthes cinctipes]